MKLSAVIITYNEAHNLRPTLEALRWADEVVVVDSHSTDGTVSIAQEFGAKVILQKFLGFGPQKRFAVEQASHDWVLVVDADEVISPALAAEIQTLQASLPELDSEINLSSIVTGYRIPRDFVFLGHTMRFGGERGKSHLRLFNRRAGNYNTASVHEDVVLEGQVRTLKHSMLHHSYHDLSSYWAKFNDYTTRGAEDLYKRGKRVSALYVVFRFPFSLLYLLLVRGLILDGYAGFLWALFSATYPVVKYAKLRDMYRRLGPHK